MSVKRVTPDGAAQLLAEGWTYLDVRSVPEFEQGHPPGAYNIPLMHRGPGGMIPNPDFGAVVSSTFSRETQMVIGCHSGQRSYRVAAMLADDGYSEVVDMQGGLAGEVSGGVVVCQGWTARKHPIATTAEPGRTFLELKERS